MATFLTNLWDAIFTAGPTPTLMVATNVAFGALQLLLLGLLLGTYSIHFAILSFLCGGLWYSINWFATEIRIAQAAEAERTRRKDHGGEGTTMIEDADDEGEETETETEGLRDSMASLGGGEEEKRREVVDLMRGTQREEARASGIQHDAEVRKRRPDEGMSSASEFSTDSEWEKVDR